MVEPDDRPVRLYDRNLELAGSRIRSVRGFPIEDDARAMPRPPDRIRGSLPLQRGGRLDI